MRKVLFICFLLCLTLINGCTPKVIVENKEVIILKMGHFSALDHPTHAAALQFKENVEKRTNGMVKIDLYEDGKLGTPQEMLEQNIVGTIDMSLPTQGSLDKYSKKFATVMLPFIFDDYEQAHKVLDGEFLEWVKEDMENQGLMILSNWEYGFRDITNNIRPIETPEDVVGLRLRTPPEIQLELTMESLGADVTKIAYPEIYLSLQQNIVDGQENPLTVIYYDKLYEVQDYLAITKHVYNNMVHVISIDSWERLTKEQQDIVLEESHNSSDFIRKEIQEQEDIIIGKLVDEGMVITYPNRELFHGKMQYAYDTISAYAGKENVEYFLKLVEKAR